MRPTTLHGVLDSLARADGRRQILAGGTMLVPAMECGMLRTEHVIDIKALTELRRIEVSPAGGMVIGAATTLSHLAAHPDVRRRFPVLATAISEVGTPQIRHRATIGGNLCAIVCPPDLAPALLGLDASCIIIGPKGQREILFADFYNDSGGTTLAHDELLTHVVLPASVEGHVGIYYKLRETPGDHVTIVGVAVVAHKQPSDTWSWRIALAAASPTPMRAYNAEAMLAGPLPDAVAIERAGKAVSEACNPSEDIRASSDYRCAMAAVLAKRGIRAVIEMILRGVV